MTKPGPNWRVGLTEIFDPTSLRCKFFKIIIFSANNFILCIRLAQNSHLPPSDFFAYFRIDLTSFLRKRDTYETFAHIYATSRGRARIGIIRRGLNGGLLWSLP